MNLLALMYHRAREGPYGNSPETLDAHFAYIARHYRCVMPGDELALDQLNVCVTFDDAYSDFHSVVLPLLRRHGLRALVAVAPNVLDEPSGAVTEQGLRPREHCTWRQLEDAVSTGYVDIGAHGLNHVPLDAVDEVDLHAEIVLAKEILTSRFRREVSSFILPYGRFSKSSLALAWQHYRHVFRIGGADNAGWNANLIYRVDADQMSSPERLFGATRLLGHRLRRYWNLARGR